MPLFVFCIEADVLDQCWTNKRQVLVIGKGATVMDWITRYQRASRGWRRVTIDNGRSGSEPMTTRAQDFERHRSLLFSIAYRMLGSVADAEDVVQEAYLRW